MPIALASGGVPNISSLLPNVICQVLCLHESQQQCLQAMIRVLWETNLTASTMLVSLLFQCRKDREGETWGSKQKQAFDKG